MSDPYNEILILKKELAIALETKENTIVKLEACEIERRELKSIVQSHSSQDKQSKELKAALADCKFQLKKLAEDIATQRTIMELDKIKFMKGYQQKISQLKQKIEHDNQDWIKRFDLQDKQFKQEVEKLRQQFTEENKKQINEFQEKANTKIQQLTKNNEQTVQSLKASISKMQKTFRQQKQHIIHQAEEKLGLELKAAHDRTQVQLNRKEKELQLRISLIQNEKKHEQSQHEYTRKQFVSVKDSLYEQVYKLTTQKDDLQKQVNQLKIETEEKTKKITALNQSIKQLQIKHDGHIKSLVQNSKKNLQSLKNKSSGDIEEVLKAQLLYVDTVETKIKILESKHNDMLEQHKIQIQHIKECYDERPSKTQDIDSIKILKQKLWKQKKQLEFAHEQVKYYKLQLDNKEEVYTKIFTNGYTQELKPISDKNFPPSPANRDYKSRRVGKSLIIRKKPDELKTQKSDYGSNIHLQVPKNIF